MTDLAPSRARHVDVKGGVRTRMVLDTSVLVADPSCISSFVGADVVIPLTVIEELDGLKSRVDDAGRAARTALRTLEELRVNAGGSLADATQVGESSSQITVKIEINGVQKHLLIEHGLDPSHPDNRIIGAALGQQMYGLTRHPSRRPHPAAARTGPPTRADAEATCTSNGLVDDPATDGDQFDTCVAQQLATQP